MPSRSFAISTTRSRCPPGSSVRSSKETRKSSGLKGEGPAPPRDPRPRRKSKWLDSQGGSLWCLLKRNPALGRPGRVTGTREIMVPDTPYILPYRVRGDAVEILRFFHAARRWPAKF
ncbi:MAG: type II toxin-antitoxin system RelE/ParE family toxin [Isosphaeraceae bacterium]